MRTLIYARYSSALQNTWSIEDQVAACRERGEREGWTIAGVYEDRAISGAAGMGEAQRPGLAALLAHLGRGGIEQVVVDSTSRLARDQGDAHQLRKLINFRGARLFSLADGEIDAFKGAFKALLDEQQRVDLAHNIRRAHRGRVAEGRSANTVAYGYRRVSKLDDRGELIRGLREVDPEQAEIVRRIYREYVAGRSAQAIAFQLNAECVPPPKRGIWRASAIAAHRGEGFGILCNPIYVGRMVYGRTKAVVDPTTRERRFVKGDGHLTETAVPHLRIIDDALYAEVQDQLARRATPRPETQRRPKHILSGLGICGVCDSPWIIVSHGNWGCSKHDGGKACTNNRRIATRKLERTVLADLKGQMLAPDVVSAYLREYHREHARQTATLGRDHDRVERRLGEATRKVDRLVAAVAEGGSEFAEIRSSLASARDDRDALARELASMDALPVLTLHPGLADQYRREIEDLDRSLAGEETRLEAVPRLRKLIARIVATPHPSGRGVAIQVVRQIDQVLAFASTQIVSVRATSR
ncbi:Site-specific DNA recombinase [Sphingomonas gellani]|uniref:Site-specific DNA recombinase n=1 Tax=Sphingomonas gellani TaxID=1166340 RepID=A0A1H8C4D7_9SPHN|nr:recombinase family protein [Sphingomonas gellani]SEM88937.1 Site-specific DNA recombinase [Sphingomonas gellani]